MECCGAIDAIYSLDCIERVIASGTLFIFILYTNKQTIAHNANSKYAVQAFVTIYYYYTIHFSSSSSFNWRWIILLVFSFVIRTFYLWYASFLTPRGNWYCVSLRFLLTSFALSITILSAISLRFDASYRFHYNFNHSHCPEWMQIAYGK